MRYARLPFSFVCSLADQVEEHLAAVLTHNETTAGQFKNSFMNTHKLLAPKPGRVEISAQHTSGPQRASLLRPKYACLSCPERACSSGERKAHAGKTGHRFCKQLAGYFLCCCAVLAELQQIWIREIVHCIVRIATTSCMTMDWNVLGRLHHHSSPKVGFYHQE